MGWRATIVTAALSPAVVRRLLACLCALDADELASGLHAPPLYSSGVRYQAEPRDGGGMREEWLTISQVLERGHGDCEDLACWRTAELWAAGELGAGPIQQATDTSIGRVVHIVVRRADGRIEDPSRRLGM